MLNSVGAPEFVKDMSLECSDMKEGFGLGFFLLFCRTEQVCRCQPVKQNHRIHFMLQWGCIPLAVASKIGKRIAKAIFLHQKKEYSSMS